MLESQLIRKHIQFGAIECFISRMTRNGFGQMSLHEKKVSVWHFLFSVYWLRNRNTVYLRIEHCLKDKEAQYEEDSPHERGQR